MKEALHGDRVVARVERAHAQGRGGTHHPRPRARHPAHRRAASRATGASAATSSPSTAACCTSCSSRRTRPAGRRAGQMVLAEITPPAHGHAQSRRPRPGRPRAPRGPGRRPQGRHGQVRPARRLPAGGRGRGDGACPTEVRPRGHRRPHRLPHLGHRHRRPGDGARPRRRDQPRPPARTAAGGWPCTSPTSRTTCRPGSAARPGGLPPRDVGVLPGPRGADAAARAVQQHLQPGRGPGPPDADGGASSSTRAGKVRKTRVPRRRDPEPRPR